MFDHFKKPDEDSIEAMPVDYIGVGAQLRIAREQAEMSMADVASQLNFSGGIVEAIEEGRFNDLPGIAYATGFVRSYAQLVGLDENDALAHYRRELSGERLPKSLKFPQPMEQSRRHSKPFLWSLLLIILVIYGGWVYWHRQSEGRLELVPAVPERFKEFLSFPSPDNSSTDKSSAMKSGKAAPAAAAAASKSTPQIDPGAASGAAPETMSKPPEPMSTKAAVAPVKDNITTKSAASNPETAAGRKPQPSAAGETPAKTIAPTPATGATAARLDNPSIPPKDPAPIGANGAPQTKARAQAQSMVDGTPMMAGDAAGGSAPDVSTPSNAPPVSGASSSAVAALGVAARRTELAVTTALKPPEKPPVMPPPPSVAPPPSFAPPPPPPPAPSPNGGIGKVAPGASNAIMKPAAVMGAGKVPQGQIFGAGNLDARIVILAIGPSWVQVRGPDNEQLLTRLLQTGDQYRVPNRAGLVLTTGNAGTIALMIDGTNMGVLGDLRKVERDVPLRPAALKARLRARNGGTR